MAMPNATTITLLLSDIEGSTSFWEQSPTVAAAYFETLDEKVSTLTAKQGGTVIKERGEGDSHFAVFSTPSLAVRAAISIQKAMRDDPVKARIAVHIGEVQGRDGDYYGPSVNRCARLRSAAHGGQILVSSAAYETLGNARSEFEWKNHGVHRLKDLAAEERVWEVIVPGAPMGELLLNTLNSSLHNLPVELTSFLGRQADLQRLHDLVLQHRMVTLFGPGGCGKTRLGLQVLGHIAEKFAGGVWFVDLSAAGPDDVLYRVGQSVQLDPIPDSISALCDALSDRVALIMLDNCEHVLPAVRAVAAPLLAACRNLRLLTTSREAISVRGEACFEVTSLSLPEVGESNEKKIRLSEAVQLFEDRARLFDSSFAMSAPSLRATAELCRRLDGMPLSIELVASQTRVYSPRQLLEMVDGEILLVVSKDDSIPSRQISIASTIEWSYSLLSSSERQTLCQISIFRGPFSLDAVLGVWGPGAVGDFQSLVEKHLVTVINSISGKRFRLLEMIRAFVASKYEDDHKTRMAHARHFGSWNPSISVDQDKANIDTALETLVQFDLAGFHESVHSWRTEWYSNGLLADGRKWLEVSVSLPDSDTSRRGQIQNALGIFCWRLSDLVAARTAFQAAKELFLSEDNPMEVAAVELNLGLVESDADKFDSAILHCEEAVRICRGLGVDERTARALYNVGICAMRMRDYVRAQETIDESLAMYERLGERKQQAVCLLANSELSLNRGDGPAARDCLTKCFEIWSNEKDHTKTSMAYLVLSLLAASTDERESAAFFLGSGLNAFSAAKQELNPTQQRLVGKIRELIGPGYENQMRDGRSTRKEQAFDAAQSWLANQTRAHLSP